MKRGGYGIEACGQEGNMSYDLPMPPPPPSLPLSKVVRRKERDKSKK